MCNPATVPAMPKNAARRADPAPNLWVDIGARIAERMDALGMKHADLAQKIGKDRSYVTRLINGKRKGDVALLSGIAEALGVEAATLLPGAQTAESKAMSDADRSLAGDESSGGYAVKYTESEYIARKLDAIDDDDLRGQAMEACSAKIRELLHPSKHSAASGSGRAVRR